MATVNPFDLLADDDNDDPSHLISVRQQKVASKKPHRTRGCAGEQIPEQAPPSLPHKQVFFCWRLGAMLHKLLAVPLAGVEQGVVGVAEEVEQPQIGGLGNGGVNGFARGYGGGVSEEGDADKPYERGRGGYGSQRQSFRGGRLGGYGNCNGGDGSDSERLPRRRRWKLSGV
ncbi:hypothetical protein B296_00051297 [Ensete ventricosum]|uniref:STM1-like N-terminal domain-containing protein n=1 Tax=Ensete ventricosum TaxID=4639 RepID=A0A426YH78_ENSVE|nr:hypothetical protein B296_00051297 [Ensete ventricosum]